MSNRLRSNGLLDVDGFTTILHSLMLEAWGEDWGTFTEAWPSGSDPKQITTPIITYKTQLLKPGKVGREAVEVKPRVREEFVTDNPQTGQKETITIKGQVMDCTLKFYVWEETNGKADALAKKFRSLLFTYQGFLMEQGVEDMLFIEQMDMDTGGFFRDNVVGKELTFFLRLEELHTMNSGVIEKVIAKIRPTMNLANDSYTQDEIHIEIPQRNKGGI